MAGLPREVHGGLGVADDHGVAQEVLDRRGNEVAELDEVQGVAYDAGMLEGLKPVSTIAGEAVEWEQGASTAIYRLEVGDGLGSGVERVSHKVLHGPTESSFDGEGVLWLNLEEVGDHSVEALSLGLTLQERLGA